MKKEDVEKVNKRLKRRDKKVIAIQSGLHPVTISRFFGGYPEDVSEETALKILTCAEKVIKDRERISKRSQKIISRLQ